MFNVHIIQSLYQVKREHLELSDKLGEGAFGKVYRGHLLQKPKFDKPLTCAVKELSGNFDPHDSSPL